MGFKVFLRCPFFDEGELLWIRVIQEKIVSNATLLCASWREITLKDGTDFLLVAWKGFNMGNYVDNRFHCCMLIGSHGPSRRAHAR